MHPILKAVLVIGLLACTAHVAAQSAPAADDADMHTLAGTLYVDHNTAAYVVVLNGTPILRSDDERLSFDIQAAYPAKGLASLVLLSYSTGVPYCPEMYLVLELHADGSSHFSRDFGNCKEFVDRWDSKERIKLYGRNNLRYVNGAWKIGFPPEKKGARGLDWFTYKDGVVTPRYKGLGEKVEGPAPGR